MSKEKKSPILLSDEQQQAITPFYLKYMRQQQAAEETTAELRLCERALVLAVKDATGVDLSDSSYAFNPDRGMLIPLEDEAAS